MSNDGRPSPLQTPLTTNAVGTMTAVHRSPSFPTLDYRAHADRIHFVGSSLPPMEPQSHPISTFGGSARSPLELPPIQISPRPRNPMRIARLLSSPRPETARPPGPTTANYPYPHSPTSSRGSSVAGIAPSQYPFAPMHLHNAEPTLPPLWHTARPFDEHTSTNHRLRVTRTLEPIDRMRYSPAVTAASSSPSYLEEEPSFELPVVSTKPLNYTLSIRQQPIAARACGFGERDRRSIDPPPTIELKITDPVTGAPEQDPNVLFALHCTLQSPDGLHDETELSSVDAHVPSTRRLMGNLVASIWEGKDEHGIPGKFFVFPDMSCRSPGQYRLRFRLLRIDPMNMRPGQSSPAVATVLTDVFNVYTAKDFPGMRPSSALLKALKDSGLTVGVKKGSEARKRNAGKKDDISESDEEDEESEIDSRGPMSKARALSSTNHERPEGRDGSRAKRRRRQT